MTTLLALSPDLLTNEETAALLGIKPNTLEIWRTKGKDPEFVKLGYTKSAPIRYLRAKIFEWLEQAILQQYQHLQPDRQTSYLTVMATKTQCSRATCRPRTPTDKPCITPSRKKPSGQDGFGEKQHAQHA